MWRLVAVVVAGALLLSVIGICQDTPLKSFEISDLQLISIASKPTWDDNWTGAVEAATILAWFNDHGFPNFLSDLNGDGVIDELDTIELADLLGRGEMKANTPHGATDSRLVQGLAKYVADKYPGQFQLKIYDTGFPMEFQQQFGKAFAPDVIPGIDLVLQDEEPSFLPYKLDLMSAGGVIIGIEVGDKLSYYLAGRSFLFEQLEQGEHGVDLAWSKEDVWTEGAQGQVLKTTTKQTDSWYLQYNGEWKKVEFMLTLHPTVPPSTSAGSSRSFACPEGAIAHDVTTTSTARRGDVKIEECVTRDGDIDTYTYTVTNISYDPDGCGIVYFAIPNTAGFETVDQHGPAGWLMNTVLSPDVLWNWEAALDEDTLCAPGIKVGESAVFSFSVIGPTVDAASDAAIARLVHLTAPDGHSDVGYEHDIVDTTGPTVAPPQNVPPASSSSACPEGAIAHDVTTTTGPNGDVKIEECVTRNGDIDTYTYTVTNISYDPDGCGIVHFAIPKTVGFETVDQHGPDGWLMNTVGLPEPAWNWVAVWDEDTLCAPGGIKPGESAVFSFSVRGPTIDTPSTGSIGRVFQDGERHATVKNDPVDTTGPTLGPLHFTPPENCPDLTIKIRNSSCTCEYRGQELVCTIAVHATVENIGDQPADHFYCALRTDKGETRTLVVTVGPGEMKDLHMWIDYPSSDPKIPPCPLEFEMEADSTGLITECDEDNNTDTSSSCCRY